ncbi:MAG: excinuclease ABC subunit UvrA [Mariniblastus sp.]
MERRQIELRGVRVNNLQDVDLDIPHGQFVAFCGLSGSGKSSLAFDTLYAEGQRRYIESLSPSTRQFINQLDKPDADRIDSIPPAVAVKAFRGKVGRKTTVGTATEITEYLRLMFAKISNVVCSDCNTDVVRHDPDSIAQRLEELAPDTKYQIVFRADVTEGVIHGLMAAKRNGFARAITNGMTIDLANPNDNASGAAFENDVVRIVVDRLKAGATDISRIRESIEIAFQFGIGECEILIDAPLDGSSQAVSIAGHDWKSVTFSRDLKCQCGRLFPTPEPRLFSFSNKYGACESCDGVGFEGKSDIESCTKCQGCRLKPDSLCFFVDGKNLHQICSLKIEDALELFNSIELSESQQAITRQIVPQIKSRLSYLCRVGLKYLTIDRTLRSLSAGEAQRVSLTSCLSSTLVNMLYVLDEPSVGLHSHDVGSLTEAISRLHQRGNTVVVVDHEEKMIRAADRIVEIGPAAGASGGELVFDGTLEEMLESETVTSDFFAGRRGVSSGDANRRKPRGRIKLTGARGNNLKNLDVEFPLGCLCLVTGVSGAGKSSLVQKTLYGAICQRKEKTCDTPLPFGDIFGESAFDEVVLVDQSPIGRSPRSNPVTYVKAFDDIRRTFADTVDAKTHNVKMGQFSFNVGTGRCDKCEGDGQLSIDMQFMSDIYIKCDQCRGTRYRDEVLAVKYRGKSIAEALDLTVREAFSFFRGQPKVQAKLKSLIDVGLDYVRLGQSATTLSSGEAQRLKLGHYLNASKSKRALFVLDEPTTGLHMSDVTRLLDCFEALLSVGHSLVVVEHNLQLMKYADWIIDLGPGAAESGGQVVVAGPPEVVANCEESITGQYLKEELAKSAS